MRDPVASLGHFRLFKEELLRNLNYMDDIICLANEFGIQLEKKGDLGTAKNDLWTQVSGNAQLMKDLVIYACQRDDELSRVIHVPIPDESCSYYIKFFSDRRGLKMEAVVESLEVAAIVEKLPKSEYARVIKEVERRLSEKKHLEASCYLMRSLPYIGGMSSEPAAWYFDFLNACLSDPSNCTIPKFVDPDFEQALTAYKVRTAKLPSVVTGQDIRLEVVDEEDIGGEQCRDQKDYEIYRERRCPRSWYEKTCDPDKIQLYLYQEELVANAERGLNTIICAPTGSGKTVVAAHIILNHLNTMKKMEKIGRVAMLVPTVPLVEQQSMMLNTYVRKIYWVEGISGSENVSEDGRAPYILASDITVMTPQIFINLLNNVRKDDRLYFIDFSLVIFDECHHCDGDHPYSVIMRMLHDYRGQKPQIIGLTASLPTGSGRLNPEAALNHMLELCARLSVHSITTVRKYREDLKSHVRPPIDEIIQAEKPSRDKFAEDIVGRMVEIEENFKKEFNAAYERGFLSSRVKHLGFPTQQQSDWYGSFIGSLKAEVNQMKNCSLKVRLIKRLETLRLYYSALCLNGLLPSVYAYEYLLKNLKDGEEDQFRRNMKPPTESIVEEENRKDILKKLHSILRDKYNQEPDSRTMIFVTTRLLAEKLADHLNHAGVLHKPRLVGYVTSSNQASVANAQSSEEQRRMIRCFNDGRIKVLVATSVAEEGLDISACNLIIKYNDTGSERSLIQRRGRARAKDSRSVLLVLNGSVEERELENIHKELLMYRCLEHIQTKTEEQMKQLVDEKIERDRLICEKERAEKEGRKAALQNRSFNLCCRICRAFICKSTDMRVACGNHYVCCDPEIWKRITIQIPKNSKSFDIATVIGKSYCNGHDGINCGEELGTVVKLFGAFLPAISAKAIGIGSQEENYFRYKKWDSIVKEFFYVDSLTQRDLSCMLKSVKKKEFDAWEAEALLAVERAGRLFRKDR